MADIVWSGLKPHHILCVPENATEAEIRTAYRRAARLYHPDSSRLDADTTTQFARVTEAYQAMLAARKRPGKPSAQAGSAPARNKTTQGTRPARTGYPYSTATKTVDRRVLNLTVGELQERLFCSANAHVRQLAAVALALQGTKMGLKVLYAALDHTHRPVRLAAIRGLAQAKAKGAIWRLAPLLYHRDPEIRAATEAAIVRLGGRHLAETLRSLSAGQDVSLASRLKVLFSRLATAGLS